ncbi:MAG: hypothetical protein ABR574_12960, partial [Cryomorphaceae bacterium]
MKSFVFGTKEGLSISWKDIKSFEFCSAAGYGMDNFGPFFDRFFLELTNKRRYFLNRAVFLYQAKDDFKTFLEEFETVSN